MLFSRADSPGARYRLEMSQTKCGRLQIADSLECSDWTMDCMVGSHPHINIMSLSVLESRYGSIVSHSKPIDINIMQSVLPGLCVAYIYPTKSAMSKVFQSSTR
jgi:hypothetical protein